MIFELINRKNAMKINIQTALVQLELAQVAEPNIEWIIVCGVEKQVSEVKK